jgi:hypothetical protein
MSAHEKAERCFALARSTTFEGERSNAIAQGTRIAEAAGLSLDLFDVPGRQRAKPERPSWRPERPTMDVDAIFKAEVDRHLREAFRRQTAARVDAIREERERAQASIKRAREVAEDQRIGAYILAIQRIGGKVRRTPSTGASLWIITSPNGGEAVVNLDELIEMAGLAMGRRA